MRILIYGINFYPELTGIGKYTGEFADACAGTGHEVRVITTPPYYPNWKIPPSYRRKRYHKEQWGEVEIIRCKIWIPKNLTGTKRILHLLSFAAFSFPPALAQAAWKPDIIFTVAPTLFTAPAAYLLARIIGAKSWLHIQDFELDAASSLGMLPASRYLLPVAQRFERMILSRFDQVSTISHCMLEKLTDKGVRLSARYYFPNWVNIKNIFPRPTNGAYREQFGIGKDAIVVLYAGNMGEKQGLWILPDSARLLTDHPEIQFVLAGEGSYRSSLRSAAEQLPNLHLIPLQPPDRLNELLNMADLHVLPQRANAADYMMPSKLTGILSSGKPVIATAQEHTEIYDLVSKVGVVVPPGEPAAFAQAIIDLAADPDTRLQLGTAGREYAERHYDKDAILVDVLDRLKFITAEKQDD